MSRLDYDHTFCNGPRPVEESFIGTRNSSLARWRVKTIVALEAFSAVVVSAPRQNKVVGVGCDRKDVKVRRDGKCKQELCHSRGLTRLIRVACGGRESAEAPHTR